MYSPVSADFNAESDVQKCALCCKLLQNRQSLKEHMQTCALKTSGLKKHHRCPFCSYEASFKCRLKAHIGLKHPDLVKDFINFSS
ncbi:hypothetical protein O3M35_011209 [Rhynocoris fuscipes]|uniref:C2H2-type domain-containing protein n=1 Tax=Rhynocoris fuscipes TaxID=488301 RepID=A0AAW1CVQ8_9HEMI